jgi:hypothetical protein
MPFYKNKISGAIIERPEGKRLIPVWEPLEMPPLRIPDAAAAEMFRMTSTEEPAEMQTFETVVDLKKYADKSLQAKTVRGAVYEYTDGQWVKISG